MGIYRGNTAPTCVFSIAKVEEIGKVYEAKTHKLNSMYVYHSVKKPGSVFKFCKFKNDKYRCISCHRAGRSQRSIQKMNICKPITLEGTSQMCIN